MVRAPGLPDEFGESVEVDHIRRRDQHVAARVPLDTHRGIAGQRITQPRHVGVDDAARAGGNGVLGPHPVDQRVYRDGTPGVHRQGSEHRTSLGGPDVDGERVGPEFDRTQ